MWCAIVVNRGLTTRVWGEQTVCTVCTVQNVWWKKYEAKWPAVRSQYVLQCHNEKLFDWEINDTTEKLHSYLINYCQLTKNTPVQNEYNNYHYKLIVQRRVLTTNGKR